MKRGDAATAERLLRAGLKNFHQTQSETFYTLFLTGLAEILMTSAQLDEALAAADFCDPKVPAIRSRLICRDEIRAFNRRLLSSRLSAPAMRIALKVGSRTAACGAALSISHDADYLTQGRDHRCRAAKVNRQRGEKRLLSVCLAGSSPPRSSHWPELRDRAWRLIVPTE